MEGIGSGTRDPGGAREPKARRREPVGGLKVEGVDAFDDETSTDDALDRDGGAATPGGGGSVDVAREASTFNPSG